MEHLAIMKKGYIEKILSGEKKIESRFSRNKITPFQNISAGDNVYMQEVGKEVTAMFEVEKVVFFDGLSESKLEELRARYGKDIYADDGFWELKKHSKYATLIYIKNPVRVVPFKVNKSDRSAFKTVSSVHGDLVLKKRAIVKHPHDCENGKHYFVFNGNTHCQFCGAGFLPISITIQKPDYYAIKEIMKISMWNDEWLNVELDNVAKSKLTNIKRADIRKILNKSIRVCLQNDGRQTPYYGNPVYYAQHGLGCCCRKCMEKFYSIPKNAVLSDDEIDYFTHLIEAYLKEQ